MLFQKKPKYILKHKNTDVLTGEFDHKGHQFRRVLEVMDERHLPCGVTSGKKCLATLNNWFLGRAIPDYRVDLKRLQKRLDFEDPAELLEEEYALSVSDHYWLVPEDEDLTYEEVNFYTRKFDQYGFAHSMFRSNDFYPSESARLTPNNTTGGYHRKCWVYHNGVLSLYKGSVGFYQQECINEWLASFIAERLGFYFVPYDVYTYEGQLVSVCPNFLNFSFELFTAGQVISTLGPGTEETFDNLLKALELNGLLDERRSLDEILILDYLMMNTDRHSQNIGILADADTNRWVGLAPVFDTGTGLGCFARTSELEEIESYKNGRFLEERNFGFEHLLERVQDLQRFDLSALDGVEDTFADVLANYRSTTGILDGRIAALRELLSRRIEKLKQAQMRVL